MNCSPTTIIIIRRLATLVALSGFLLYADLAEARRGFSRSFGRSMTRSLGKSSRGAFSLGTKRRSATFGSKRPRASRKGGFFGRKSSRGRAMGASAARQRSSTKYSRYKSSRLGHSKMRKGSAASQQKRAKRYYSGRQPVRGFRRGFYAGPMAWGYGSVGIWDIFFLSSVSRMFWYHHWHDPGIQRALYKENMLQDEELKKLEARVKELEGEGVPRDPNYLPEGVDPDLAYSKEYVASNRDEFYASKDEPEEGGGFLSIFSFMFLMASLWYLVGVRRYA